MSEHTFTTDGLTFKVALRLNPIHSAIVHLLQKEERPILTLEVTNAGAGDRTLHVAVQVDRYSDEVEKALTVHKGEKRGS